MKVKLLELVKYWALDSVTGMVPRLTNNQPVIDLSPTMSSLVYGVDIILGFASLDSKR